MAATRRRVSDAVRRTRGAAVAGEQEEEDGARARPGRFAGWAGWLASARQ
jgi:hypothetical protein